MPKAISIAPGTTVEADKDTTFMMVATYSDSLETVFNNITVIQRDKAGTFWITQENGDLTEIPGDKYLYLQVSKVFKE